MNQIERKMDVEFTHATAISAMKTDDDKESDILFVADRDRILEIEVSLKPLEAKAQIMRTFPTRPIVSMSIVIHNNLLTFSDISENNGGIHQINLETGQKETLIPSTDACKPHGLAILNNELIYSDPVSHQVKKYSSEQPDVVLIGSGSTGRKYGPAKSASLTQPTGLTVVGKTIFLCDSAEASLLTCSPTEGFTEFYSNLYQYYSAYDIHTDKTSCTPDEAIKTMKKIKQYFIKTKEDVKQIYKLQMKPQGPQGCVSTVFTDNVTTAVFVLETLITEYPETVHKMRTKSIQTKVIESIFSLTRHHNLTPDPYEFGQIFTKLVKQQVLQCSGNIEFLYILNPRKKDYYEKSNCFMHIDIPSLPPRNRVEITPDMLQALRDYKAMYLQGVRQNSIRNTNTKHKAGTMPEYAYSKPDPPPQPVNFHDFHDVQAPQPPQPPQPPQAPETEEIAEDTDRNIIYDDKASLLIASPSGTSSSEIQVAICEGPIYENQTSASVCMYQNTDQDPYLLVFVREEIIDCSKIIREILIESMPTLTELEYNDIVDNDISVLVTVQEELENIESEAADVPEAPEPPEPVTRSGRITKTPSRFKDRNVIMW